jgi:hypothetical protein
MSGALVIDLRKMDIEGFEYDNVDGILNGHIPARQILVVFHS